MTTYGTAFRNVELFRAEWLQASAELSKGERRVLEAVVIHGQSQGQIATEMQRSNGQTSKTLHQALRLMREAARRKPNGELAHTRDALTEAAETSGTPAWAFVTASRDQQRAIASRLDNLGSVGAELRDLLGAACALVDRPREPRANLRSIDKKLSTLAKRREAGLSSTEALAVSPREQERLASWPSLDWARFTVARLGSKVAIDGRIRLEVTSYGRNRRIGHLMVQALRERGDCMEIDEIAAAAGEMAAQEGMDTGFPDYVWAKIANNHDQIRWAGPRTYGLAEWNVGLSNPYRTPGSRGTTKDELLHLLDSRPVIPMTEVLEHFRRRFKIADKTIPSMISDAPDLAVRNGLVMRSERAGPPPANQRGPRNRPIRKEALQARREELGLSRETLARMCGTGKDMIRRYEQGIHAPRPERLTQLADALRISAEHLLGDQEHQGVRT